MLTKLTRLHRDIEGFIETLAALGEEPVPRLDAVAAARLDLTRASRSRTTFLETTLYPRLLGRLSGEDRSKVEALRDSGRQTLIASIGHIGEWTLTKIGTHWSEYRAASRAMRASMRARIEEERTILYPLLKRGSGEAA